MCALATERETDWVMLDPWEASQEVYRPTVDVLDHFQAGVDAHPVAGATKPTAVALLAGADLLATMSDRVLWKPHELEHIFGHYRAFVVERLGTDVEKALAGVAQWRERISVIPQPDVNDVSSTKVRQLLREGKSIDGLVPKSVVEYIQQHGLYREQQQKPCPGSNITE